jgi:predicted amidohydrolase YtcJ
MMANDRVMTSVVAPASRSSSPKGPPQLDVLLKPAAAHSMTGATYRAVWVRGSRIVAVSPDAHGLDDLAGPKTLRADAGELTMLPAFSDSHEHLTLLVPVDRARSVAEFAGIVADAVATAVPGQWIVTSMAWHESNLAEDRLPTKAELDAIAPSNPVFSRRGGHLSVVNSAALRAAGFDPDSADPPGGKIGRAPDGQLTGVLEGTAVYQMGALVPQPSTTQLAGAIGACSRAYAALGVATIREAMVNLDELLAYGAAARAARLSLRVRPMLRVGNEGDPDAAMAFVHGLGAWSGLGDDWLRIWGLKFVMDGGVEGGAVEEPYVNDPTNTGHLNWDRQAMTRVCTDAVRRGWRIGTHAAGDRAVRSVLDVYQAVLEQAGPLPPWSLVIEHALLSDPAQRARAAKLGIGITVQHTLLWNMGSEMLTTWGEQRTRHVNPIDEWLAAGAQLAAGSDITRPLNPMTNVWGMITRRTRSAGIQGPEHAIDAATAIRLYTLGSAALNGETDRLGSIAEGKLADLAAYPIDPLTADADELAELSPALTMVGGRATYDPDNRLSE